MLPLLGLGFGCDYIGFHMRKPVRPVSVQVRPQTSLVSKTSDKVVSNAIEATVVNRVVREHKPEDKLVVEPIELELGFRLIKLADPDAGGDLMERVTQLRNRIAAELGIILPKVKIRDSLRLKDTGYRIKFRDVAVASGDLRMDALLAIDNGLVSGELSGESFVEPSSGRAAYWIEPSHAEHAKSLGYKVVEPAVALMAHLTEIVKSHADELLTRQQVHQLLDNLKKSSPKVVDELIPELLKPSQVHQILGNLLREQVPVRDLETILETLGDYAGQTKDITILTEYTRHSLSRTICQQYRDSTRTIHAITLDPALEDVIAGGFEFGERGLVVKLTPQVIDGVTNELLRQSNKLVRAGHPAVVVCSAQVRPVLRHIVRSSMPKLAVLSLQEMTRDTFVRPISQIPVNAIKIPSKRTEEVKQYMSLAAAMN